MTDKAKASEHDLREGSKPRCPKCQSATASIYYIDPTGHEGHCNNVDCCYIGKAFEFFPIAAILEENQRLAKELERFTALEAHLPKGYAIGDDATAELAVKLGKMREALEALRVMEAFARSQGEKRGNG